MADDIENGSNHARPDEMLSEVDRKANLINQQNEAEDINKMVDEGIISTDEAANFSHETEIEIPEALLSNPPKISKTLSEHIISKFTDEDFKPENIEGTGIHGTSIDVIKPLWWGEGRSSGTWGQLQDNMFKPEKDDDMPIDEYYGRIKSSIPVQDDEDERRWRSQRVKKGLFNFQGWFSPIGPGGFGDRKSLKESNLPVILVAGKYVYGQFNEGHGEFGAIVLDPVAEKGQIDRKIDFIKRTIVDINDGLSASYPLENHLRNIFREKVDEILDPSKLKNILDDMQDWYSDIPETQLLLNYQRITGILAKDAIHLIEKVNHNDQASNEDLTALRYFYFKMIVEQLNADDLQRILDDQIRDLESLKSAHPNESLYSFNSVENYFTKQEAVNYCANIMVQGIDKSKILPIYDRDGNLLWPREEDVKREPESEQQSES